MGLISAYVAGFGALRDVNFDFSQGLNSYCMANGSGKSTLAAFLKAMLYGLPSYKSNTRGFEDRRHYYPFEGGSFGGSLTLEYGGKIYCISRRFDAKSETKDALAVTWDGKPTRDLGDCPGKVIFRVDRESFERTAFFTAEPGEVAATDGIAARLQSLVGSSTGGDYVRGETALAEAARQLQGPRGQTGKIPQLTQKIKGLQQDVQTQTQLQQALAARYARKKALEAELAREQEALEQSRSRSLAREQWDVYRRMDEQAARAEADAAALEAACGKPQPTAQAQAELDRCRDALMASLPLEDMSREKREQLAALRAAYPRGVPGQETLAQAAALDEQLRRPAQLPEQPGHTPWWLLGLIPAVAGVAVAFFALWPGVLLAALGIALAVVLRVLSRRKETAYARLCQWEREKRDDLSRQLTALLKPYGLQGYHPRLHRDGVYLETLAREEAELSARNQARRSGYDDALAQAGEIFSRCGLALSSQPEQDIARLLEDLEALPEARANAARLRGFAQEYRAEKGLVSPPPAPAEDASGLAARAEAHRRELAAIREQIGDLEYRLEDLADCALALEEAREQLAALEEHHRLLLTARACLENAEQSLRRKHISPVKTRFDHYAGALEEALGARLALDKDFRLYLRERSGQQDARHLSPGQRAMAALCLRLSLLDNLYPGEKPPVLLDDPFAFLDSGNLEKASAMLRELAREWQIFYFTCHESRKI